MVGSGRRWRWSLIRSVILQDATPGDRMLVVAKGKPRDATRHEAAPREKSTHGRGQRQQDMAEPNSAGGTPSERAATRSRTGKSQEDAATVGGACINGGEGQLDAGQTEDSPDCITQIAAPGPHALEPLAVAD
ncbi:hypothetical protein K505DRAFT_367953 [Melanomma pulvis-pyrius CBS 109.77]|uniref:Uncharacterized protein n=1 Tax=Melanomma pulvis-pyrius CBS 109.77 TaxID=1314802 RepID=A0A6A6WRM9_9PLEO|nr:hypothetical protein K505DRAFT_367953 [Melanomma pulvis-pyrius CBS 109.77]